MRREWAGPLRLGILGMSEGNGHPYSWSAIFNGYDDSAMAACPFPAIPAYLRERRYPEDFLGALGEVTHVWAQDSILAADIARASRIAHVVERPEAMIGAVDAILLARDDAENHLILAPPFLRAGLPIFIDKPLAVRTVDAKALLALEQWPGQLFSCTALRYAAELRAGGERLRGIGRLRRIEGVTPKGWKTYGVHVVEPVIAELFSQNRAPLVLSHRAEALENGGRHVVVDLEDGLTLDFTATGSLPSPIKLTYVGDRGVVELVFRDSFAAFRTSLEHFVDSLVRTAVGVPREETLSIVEILERGQGALS